MNERSDVKLRRLREDLARAKEKAAEWQARAQEIERKIKEQENTEILCVVRSVAASPEELRALLERIRTTWTMPPEDAGETVSDGVREEGQECLENMDAE